MSAKGRRRGEAIPLDYFPTPAWSVHRLLDDCAEDLGVFDGDDVQLLEPTVGDGAIVRALDSWPGLRSADALPSCTGVELRRDALDPRTRLAHHFEGVDFRSWDPRTVDPVAAALLEEALHPTGEFDIALGNPPFSVAESIIRRAMELARVVVMLLRISFLSSAERVPFWRGLGADVAVRVLPDRPSFDGEGQDSAAYAWFIWGSELSGVDVLEPTPEGVRAAQKEEARSARIAVPQQSLFGGFER